MLTDFTTRHLQLVEKWHQEYGPIVRIGPNEVHLADAEHYDTIYYVGSKVSAKSDMI